jgi:hypothetical protein
MPVEEVLRLKTFKQKGLARRVFNVLQDDKELQTHRNSLAIAKLFDHLHHQGFLSDDEIDKILLDCTM